MLEKPERTLTFVFHSHKILDQEVFPLINLLEGFTFQFIDLSRNDIPESILEELIVKMNEWQERLVDAQYLDHSIKNPEEEFLNLQPLSKIKFLRNNAWAIGTPIVIDNEEAIRFEGVNDVFDWINKIRSEAMIEEEISLLDS